MSFLNNIPQTKHNSDKLELRNCKSSKVTEHNKENIFSDIKKSYKSVDNLENGNATNAVNLFTTKMRNNGNASTYLKESVKVHWVSEKPINIGYNTDSYSKTLHSVIIPTVLNSTDVNSTVNNVTSNFNTKNNKHNKNYNNINSTLSKCTWNDSKTIYKRMGVEGTSQFSNFNIAERTNLNATKSFIRKKNMSPTDFENEKFKEVSQNTQEANMDERKKYVLSKNLINNEKANLVDVNSMTYFKDVEETQFHRDASDIFSQNETTIYHNICNKNNPFLNNGKNRIRNTHSYNNYNNNSSSNTNTNTTTTNNNNNNKLERYSADTKKVMKNNNAVMYNNEVYSEGKRTKTEKEKHVTTSLNINQTNESRNVLYCVAPQKKEKCTTNHIMDVIMNKQKLERMPRQVRNMINNHAVNTHVSCHNMNNQRTEFSEHSQKKILTNDMSNNKNYNVRSFSAMGNAGNDMTTTNRLCLHTNELGGRNVPQYSFINMNNMQVDEMNNMTSPVSKDNSFHERKAGMRSYSSLIRPAHLKDFKSRNDAIVKNHENRSLNELHILNSNNINKHINNNDNHVKQNTSPILKVSETPTNNIGVDTENYNLYQKNLTLNKMNRARIGSELLSHHNSTTTNTSEMELNGLFCNSKQEEHKKRNKSIGINSEGAKKLQMTKFLIPQIWKQPKNNISYIPDLENKYFEQNNILKKNNFADAYQKIQNRLIEDTFDLKSKETMLTTENEQNGCTDSSTSTPNYISRSNTSADGYVSKDIPFSRSLHKKHSDLTSGTKRRDDTCTVGQDRKEPNYKICVSNNPSKIQTNASNQLLHMNKSYNVGRSNYNSVSKNVLDEKEQMSRLGGNKNYYPYSQKIHQGPTMYLREMRTENDLTSISTIEQEDKGESIHKPLENKKKMSSEKACQALNSNGVSLVNAHIKNSEAEMVYRKSSVHRDVLICSNVHKNVSNSNKEIRKKETEKKTCESTKRNLQNGTNKKNKTIVTDQNAVRKNSNCFVENESKKEAQKNEEKENIQKNGKSREQKESFSSLCRQFEEVTEQYKKTENTFSKSILENAYSIDVFENKNGDNNIPNKNHEIEQDLSVIENISKEVLKRSTSNASHAKRRKYSDISEDNINPDTYRLMDDDILTDSCIYHFKNKKDHLNKKKDQYDSDVGTSEPYDSRSVLESEMEESGNEVSGKSSETRNGDNTFGDETEKHMEPQIFEDTNEKYQPPKDKSVRNSTIKSKISTHLKKKAVVSTSTDLVRTSVNSRKIRQVDKKVMNRKKKEQDKCAKFKLKKNRASVQTSEIQDDSFESDRIDSDDLNSDDFDSEEKYDNADTEEEEGSEEMNYEEYLEKENLEKENLEKKTTETAETTENNNSTTFPWDRDAIIKIRTTDMKKGSNIIMNTKLARYERVLIHTCVNNLKWKKCNDNANKGTFHWVGYNINDADHFNYMKKKKIINRIPSIYMYTKKKALTFLLSHLSFIYPHLFDFYPTTFVLPENRNLLKYVLNNNSSNDYYIMKPDGGSMGLGVKLINKFSDISANILNGYNSYVIQKYIDCPLLMYKKKFDFRIYALLIPGKKYPKIYLSRVGFARLCTEEYKKKKKYIGNTYVHLTNYSINKDNNKYIRKKNIHDKNNNKQLLSDVFIFLKENGYDTNDIWMQIKKICCLTSLAMYSYLKTKIKYNYRNNFNFYQLIGLDIILDDSGKAWLLEVNSNPSLRIDYIDPGYNLFEIHLESMFDRYVKEPVISEMFHIVYKKIYKKYFMKKKGKRAMLSGNTIKNGTLSNSRNGTKMIVSKSKYSNSNNNNNYNNNNDKLRNSLLSQLNSENNNSYFTKKEDKLTDQKYSSFGKRKKLDNREDLKGNAKKETERRKKKKETEKNKETSTYENDSASTSSDSDKSDNDSGCGSNCEDSLTNEKSRIHIPHLNKKRLRQLTIEKAVMHNKAFVKSENINNNNNNNSNNKNSNNNSNNNNNNNSKNNNNNNNNSNRKNSNNKSNNNNKKNNSNNNEEYAAEENDTGDILVLKDIYSDQMEKEGSHEDLLLQKDETPKKTNEKYFQKICSVGRVSEFEENETLMKRIETKENDTEKGNRQESKSGDIEVLSRDVKTPNTNATDNLYENDEYKCCSTSGSNKSGNNGNGYMKINGNKSPLKKKKENNEFNNSTYKCDCSSNSKFNDCLHFNKEQYEDSGLGTTRDICNCEKSRRAKSADLERSTEKPLDNQSIKDVKKEKNTKRGIKLFNKEIEKLKNNDAKKINKERETDSVVESSNGNKETYVQINDHIDIQLDKILNDDIELYKNTCKNISDNVYKNKIENMIMIRSNLYKYMNCLNVLGIRYVNKDISTMDGMYNNNGNANGTNSYNNNNLINGNDGKKTFTKIRKDILHPLKNDILEKNVYIYLKGETGTYYNNMKLYNQCLYLYEYVLKKYDSNLKKKKKKFEYYIDKAGFICMCKDVKINKLLEHIEIPNGSVHGRMSEAYKQAKDMQMYQIVKEMLKNDQPKNENKQNVVEATSENTEEKCDEQEKNSSDDYYHLSYNKKNKTKNMDKQKNTKKDKDKSKDQYRERSKSKERNQNKDTNKSKKINKKKRTPSNGNDLCHEDNSDNGLNKKKVTEKKEMQKKVVPSKTNSNTNSTTTRISEKRNNSYCCSSENVLDNRKRNASSSYYTNGFCPFSFNSTSNMVINFNTMGINDFKQKGKKKIKMNIYDLEFLYTRQIFFNKYMNKSLGLTIIDFFLLLQQIALLVFPYINNLAVYNTIYPYNSAVFDEMNSQEQIMLDPIVNEKSDNYSTRLINSNKRRTSIIMSKKLSNNKKRGEIDKEQMSECKGKTDYKNIRESSVKDRKCSDKNFEKKGIITKIPHPIEFSTKTENSAFLKNEEKKKDPLTWHKNICNNVPNLYEYTQIHVKTELKNMCLETLLTYVFNKYGISYRDS